MASPTMTDHQLAEKHGRRLTDAGGVSLFTPNEWGYRCPQGHRNNLIVWSKFNGHVWCHRCQMDYPMETCPIQRPIWMNPGQFRSFLRRLPFKPKVLPGVDNSLAAKDREGPRM